MSAPGAEPSAADLLAALERIADALAYQGNMLEHISSNIAGLNVAIQEALANVG